MSALFAFLHHLAAFALVGALAVEFALIRGELTVGRARSLQIADVVIGASAGARAGGWIRARLLLRERGGVLLSQRAVHREGERVRARRAAVDLSHDRVSFVVEVPEAGTGSERGAAQAADHPFHHSWELAGVVVLLLCAALMARGVGTFG
jgi:putative membrane protein